MRALFLGLAALLAAAGTADARMHHPYRAHRIVPANAGVLDTFTTPSAAYSFRKLRTAYAGSAVQLRRVDTTTQNIGFTASGDFDSAAAAAFCTTACTIQTLYDQSGNARHLVQATPANQPAYVAACNGSLPCASLTSGQSVSLGGQTPSAVLSINVVVRLTAYSSGSNACAPIIYGSNQLTQHADFDLTILSNSTTTLNNTASSRLGLHSHIGVFNGAGAVNSVDGVEATGTLSASVAAGNITIGSGTAGNICQVSEAIAWSGYALTADERAALTQNQKNYWTPAPLDGFAQPAAAYSFRKLRSAYSGPAIRIRRASDNAELDINFLGFTGFTGAPWDAAAATAHCAATSCFIRTWYDQSGVAGNIEHATPASQPALVLNCTDSLPCARETAFAQQLLTAGNVTPATGTVTLSVVARRAAGPTVICGFLYQNQANRLTTIGVASTWAAVGGGGGSVTRAASDTVVHAGIGVVAGAASALYIDGTATTGTAVGNTVAGKTSLGGGAAATCEQMELVYWDNYAMPGAEAAAWTANQRSFWGTP